MVSQLTPRKRKRLIVVAKDSKGEEEVEVTLPQSSYDVREVEQKVLGRRITEVKEEGKGGEGCGAGKW